MGANVKLKATKILQENIRRKHYDLSSAKYSWIYRKSIIYKGKINKLNFTKLKCFALLKSLIKEQKHKVHIGIKSVRITH